MKLIQSLFLFSIVLTSCQKKELPVPKHDAGNVITNTVDMDQSYKWQIYFDFKTNSVVGKNLRSIWDLGFENGATGTHLILNSSKLMFALNTGSSDFNSITIADTNGLFVNRKWDAPSGDFDSTAIGNWQTNTPVYIIDRGYNEYGTHLGFRKIQILSVDATSYSVKFANMDGTGENTLQILKDDTYNFSFLSFTTSATLIVEPPKDSWDVVFTQYTHTFYNPLQPYLVTGCLLNIYNTKACFLPTVSFADISFEQTATYSLSNAINSIGYDWKYYDGNTYTTNTNYSYVLEDQEGYFYKLHFIDFYNQLGVKGCPTFEFQKL